MIVTALNALDPAVVDQAALARAEQVLVDHAARFGPRELRRIGERILEVVAPTIAEEAERKKLEAEQARARAATRLDLRRRGDGSTDLRARIPDAIATRLKAYLDAFASPRHDSSTSKSDRSETTPGGVPAAGLVDPATGRRLPADRIRGIAFVAFLEAADPHRMPIHGGDATTPVVTIDVKDLQAGTGPATLADGTRSSPGELRRLACTAAIVPAVLGTRSEVPDLGRTSRLFNRSQRKALASNTPNAAPKAAPSPQPGAKPTTSDDPGPEAAAPTSPTASCCAPTTTTAPTTRPTRSTTSPTATSASTSAPELSAISARSTGDPCHVGRQSPPPRPAIAATSADNRRHLGGQPLPPRRTTAATSGGKSCHLGG